MRVLPCRLGHAFMRMWSLGRTVAMCKSTENRFVNNRSSVNKKTSSTRVCAFFKPRLSVKEVNSLYTLLFAGVYAFLSVSFGVMGVSFIVEITISVLKCCLVTRFGALKLPVEASLQYEVHRNSTRCLTAN